MDECVEIVCPTCGENYGDDGWDVLPENEVHGMKCYACNNVFFSCVFECDACAADNVISSQHEHECHDRRCRACGHRPDLSGESHDEAYL